METWEPVREFVFERLDQLELLDEEEKRAIKFNIYLDSVTNRRAELLAKALRMSRTAFCGELISSALSVVEKTLGLDVSDLDSEYSKSVLSVLTQSKIEDVKGE